MQGKPVQPVPHHVLSARQVPNVQTLARLLRQTVQREHMQQQVQQLALTVR